MHLPNLLTRAPKTAFFKSGFGKFLLVISFFILTIGLPLSYFFFQKNHEVFSWYNDSWEFRKEITVTNAGTDKVDYDLLITLDTAALITAGKIQNDCDDVRFVANDNTTALSYWIEGGCNTSSTQIWVRIPSLTTAGTSIYLYYGNGSATNAQQSWTGTFTVMSTSACPAGWTRNNLYDGKYPMGKSIYGLTGGVNTHDHPSFSLTSGLATTMIAQDGPTIRASNLGHSISFTMPGFEATPNFDTGTFTTYFPLYRTMMFCYKGKMDLSTGMLGMFDSATPSGWTRYSNLDGRFPVGSSIGGFAFGFASHTHGTTPVHASGVTYAYITSAAVGSNSAGNHVHNNFGGTGAAYVSNLPPYLDTVYATINADGTIPVGGMSFASSVPPFGWSVNSAYEDKFLRGSVTYGGTGGTVAHTHDISITLLSTHIAHSRGYSTTGVPTDISASNHTHTVTGTSTSGNQLPPYFSTLVVKKNDNSVDSISNVISGTEESRPPLTPLIGAAQGLSTTSIRWNFVDMAPNETGIKVYDMSGVLKATCVGVDLTYCDETGLSPNTQYTRQLKAYNDDGESQTFSASGSRYTLAPLPVIGNLSNPQLTTIDINSMSLVNIDADLSGYYFECYLGTNCNTGLETWVKTASVTASGLDSNKQYHFRVKFRNGDGVETGFSGSNSLNTLAPVPTISLTNTNSTTVTLGVTGISNVGIGNSAVYFECIAFCTTSNAWTSIGNSGTEVISGLTPNSLYQFRVKARNGENVQTAFSTIGSIVTLASAPLVPTLSDATTSSVILKLNSNLNGNPSETEFAVNYGNLGEYVNASTGMIQSTPFWTTFEGWGNTNGIEVFGLEEGISHSFSVVARNSDNVQTAQSSIVTINTSLLAPVIGSGTSISASSIRWNFTDSTRNELGVKLYDENDNLVATCIGVNLTYCDETSLSSNTSYTRKIASYNSDGESGKSLTRSAYTRTNTPDSPSVNFYQTSAVITLNSSGNPAQTLFSVYESTTGKYVQNDGTLALTEVRRTLLDWGTITVSGLIFNTQYSFVSKAINDDLSHQSTSTSITGYTLTDTLGLPSLNTVSTSALNVVIGRGGNPLSTNYAIFVEEENKYVNKSTGQLQASEDWGTFAQFGSASGINIVGLNINTQYTVKVKAKNGDNVIGSYSGSVPKFTLATIAGLPVLAPVSSTVLKATLQSGVNNANTLYALRVNDTNYVDYESGLVQSNPSWGTIVQWGGTNGVGIINLSPSVSYSFKVIAMNGDGIETDATSQVSKYTLANTPTQPTVTRISSTNARVEITRNGNPLTVEFVIFEANNGNYYDVDGSISAQPVWGTFADFGGSSGLLIQSLQAGSSYDFKVKGRNGEDVETSYSTSGAGYSALGTPEILIPTVIDTSTIRWNFSNNLTNESGFRVFTEDGTQVAQCASADISYCDEYGLNSNTSYTRKIAAYDSIGNGDFTSSATIVTFSYLPDSPTLQSISSSSVKLKLNINGNNNGVKYLVRENISGLYLNYTTGNLQAGETWGTYADFGGDTGININNLFANARYSFEAKSRNLDEIETGFSTITSIYTLPASIGVPLVLPVSDSILNIRINNGGNNSATEFSVQERGGMYISKLGGRLSSEPVWGKFSDFGSTSGVNVIGLLPNSSYEFKVFVRNGDLVVSQATDGVSMFTHSTRPDAINAVTYSPNSILIKIPEKYRNVDSKFSIGVIETNRYLNFAGEMVTEANWGNYLQWGGSNGILVQKLTPGKGYTFVIKTKNSLNVETEYSEGQVKYTYALAPEKPLTEVVSTTSARINIIDPGNDSNVVYAIQEVKSKKFVSKQNGSLVKTPTWGTYAEFGGSQGFVVIGLPSASDLEFRIIGRNGSQFETSYSTAVAIQTNAVIVNPPNGVETLLKENEEVNVTQVEGSQRGIKEISLVKDGSRIANMLINFDSDKDWSAVSVDTDETQSKSVIKVRAADGLIGDFTLFVPINDTVKFRLCPESSTLSEVSSNCAGSVVFEGDFPQTKDFEGGSVTVSKNEIDGKMYWSASGLKGTGGLGEKETVQIPEVIDPNVIEKTDGKTQVTKIAQNIEKQVSTIENKTVKNVAKAIFVDAPSSTVLAMNSVSNVVELTPIANLNEPELVVVSTTITTATVAFGLSVFAGGFSNIPYLFLQLAISILSFLGFNRRVRPYGLVYDSVTKKPVNRAIVRIYNLNEKLVWTDVTSAFGTFGANLPIGKYKILVVKPGYKFPSTIVTGEVDYPLEPVYRGGEIKFSRKNEFNIVIPIDPIEKTKIIKFISKILSSLSVLVKFGHILFFLAGLVLGIHTCFKYPSLFNLSVLLLYIPAFCILLKNIFVKNRSKGIVMDKDGKPISGVTVTLKEMKFDKFVGKRVTDSNGEYQFIVPNNIYQVGIADNRFKVVRFEGGSSIISQKNNRKEIVIDKSIVVKKI